MIEHEQQQRITPQYTREQPSIGAPPTHWADSIAAAVTKRQKPKPLDLEEFLNDSRPPMLTEDDMERFARKQPERLTEQQTRAFADQLEQYLMHDRDNPDYIDEGNALRRLAQYIKWKILASWLQLYANPTIRFCFSKREFWHRKYDEHAHFCMPQPHQTPDITESIDRLANQLIDLHATLKHDLISQYHNNQIKITKIVTTTINKTDHFNNNATFLTMKETSKQPVINHHGNLAKINHVQTTNRLHKQLHNLTILHHIIILTVHLISHLIKHNNNDRHTSNNHNNLHTDRFHLVTMNRDHHQMIDDHKTLLFVPIT